LEGNRKFGYLDGLRGIAALIVTIHHFVLAFYPALYTANPNQSHTSNDLEVLVANTPLNLFYAGNFSVCIFFVLSGYVLSYKFFATQNTSFVISSAIRRYFRLSIPVAFSIILAYVLLKLDLFYNVEAGKLSFSDWWLSTFWNFETSFLGVVSESFYGVFFTSNINYNPVLWTMKIELFGSFLVFAILLTFRGSNYRWIMYLLLCIILWDSYYLAFLLGMILSDLRVISQNKIRKYKMNWLYSVPLLIISLYLGSYPDVSASSTIYSILPKWQSSVQFYHILGAFMLVLFVLISKTAQKLLLKKTCSFLGKISFSMYLIHFLIIGTFSSALFLKLQAHLPYYQSVTITTVISLFIIFILSYPIYKYVDLGAIWISKRISDKLMSVKSIKGFLIELRVFKKA